MICRWCGRLILNSVGHTVARGDEDDEDEEVDISVARAMEKPEEMDTLSLAQYLRELEEAGTPQVCHANPNPRWWRLPGAWLPRDTCSACLEPAKFGDELKQCVDAAHQTCKRWNSSL